MCFADRLRYILQKRKDNLEKIKEGWEVFIEYIRAFQCSIFNSNFNFFFFSSLDKKKK